MNISRHNYEEYFILYMDNELAPAERRMVEDFVQLHPDLKEELELLQQFKLTPDTNIVFAGKEELLKGKEVSIVNLSNYEEYLLLYTDHELNPAQKAAVEQFASENLAVQKELDLLRFTRLQPESIEFPDKASLYRREEKVRALPVRWWRAAAAILILALGLSAVWMISRQSDEAAVAGATPGKEQIKSPAPIRPENSKEELAVTKDTTESLQLQESKLATNSIDNIPADQKVKQSVQTANKEPLPDKMDALANRQPDNRSNNLPQPVNNPNIVTPNEIAVKPVLVNNNPKGILTKTDVTNNTGSSPDIKPGIDFAVAKQPETEIETDGNDGKKNKLRGFFRKVTRTFEKRTNIDPTDQDNRLLVGGLAIKLK
jgi:anti-sigma factor RsiW